MKSLLGSSIVRNTAFSTLSFVGNILAPHRLKSSTLFYTNPLTTQQNRWNATIRHSGKRTICSLNSGVLEEAETTRRRKIAEEEKKFIRRIEDRIKGGYLQKEIAAARQEKRPYNIDKTKLTNEERHMLRLISKAIPMVADQEPLDIIYEDEWFLVVNKPSFIKMHPSHRFQGGSLLNRAIGYLGYTPYILHRLDMHTTGVVVLSKKKEICHSIMKQFQLGLVTKQYLCVVDGNSDKEVGCYFSVDAPIQRHETVQFMRTVGDDREDSKTARTTFRILNKSMENNMMLLEATPETGRTHQIRVHASHMGLPIVGDDLYNPKEHALYESVQEISDAAQDVSLLKYADGNILRRGLKLHAWKISLTNPKTDQIVKFTAERGGAMQELCKESGF